MSLILDALNRADQERSVDNNSPSIQTSHGPTPQPSSPSRRWLMEGVIIAVALCVLIYSQWPKTPTINSVSPAAVTRHSVTTPIEPVALKNKAANIAAVQTILPTVDSKTIEEKISESTAAQSALVNNQQPSIQKEPVLTSIADHSAIASLYQQKELSIEAKEILPLKPNKNKPVDNSERILQQIPLLTQRSPKFQKSVPSIVYNVHVYSENDRAGFVKLNGAIRKIGAEIEPGLRVIAILNDSVVLDYNGSQFRLAALNSWMNFN